MRKVFNCYRTFSQVEIEAGKLYEVSVTGRDLEKLSIGDKIASPVKASYNFECEIVAIISYGSNLSQIGKSYGCQLTLRSNNYLDNDVEFLYGN